MEWYACLDPEQLVMIAAVLAITIAKNLQIREINSLANLLQAIGENLSVIAAQRSLNEKLCCDYDKCKYWDTEDLDELI